MTLGKVRREGLSADLGIIALVWLAASMRVLSGSRFIPYDSIDEFFPQVRFVVTSILSGDSPWWNPYQYSGLPVLGDPQSMVFTLHTLAGLLLGDRFGVHAFDIATLAYPLAGGLALYGYGRAHGGSRFTAMLGGIVFMLGGVASSRLQHVPQVVSYGMLPMLLLALHQLSRMPTYWRGLGVGLLGGVFAMNPNQVTFLGGLLLLPFAFLHFLNSSNRGRFLAMAGVSVLIAMVMAAPTLAAILDFIGESNRASFSLHDSAGAALPPFALLSLVLPGLFGVASGQPWAVTDISQDYLYIGVLPALMIAILLAGRDLPTNRIALLALLSCLAAGMYLLGVHTPIYPWLFNNVPGFSLFRRPADGAYLLNFFVAVLLVSARFDYRDPAAIRPLRLMGVLTVLITLLALGYPALQSFAASRGASTDLRQVLESGAIRFGFASLGLVGLVLWARAGRDHQVVIPLVALLAMLDLTVPGRTSTLLTLRYDQRAIARYYLDRSTIPHPGRIAEYRELVDFLKRGTVVAGVPQYRVEIVGDELAYGYPSAVRLPSTQGYNPLLLRAYSQIFPSTQAAPPKTFSAEAEGYLDDWYRRIGLRFVVLPHYITKENSGQFGEHGEVFVSIRRSLQIGGARMVKAGDAYEVWELPRPDPKVVLYDAQASPSNLVDSNRIASDQYACAIKRYRNTGIDIGCETPSAALLVLSEVAAKGWTACVNGEPAPILAAAGLLRSVRIPSGQSQVTLRYQAVPFLRSAGCSDD